MRVITTKKNDGTFETVAAASAVFIVYTIRQVNMTNFKLKLSSCFKGLSIKSSKLFRKRSMEANDPVKNENPLSSPISDDANLDTTTTKVIDMKDITLSFKDFCFFLSSLFESLFE